MGWPPARGTVVHVAWHRSRTGIEGGVQWCLSLSTDGSHQSSRVLVPTGIKTELGMLPDTETYQSLVAAVANTLVLMGLVCVLPDGRTVGESPSDN